MAYTIYQSDGTQITVADNIIDPEFYNASGGGGIGGPGQGQGIQLVGKNTVGYGPATAQNFLQLTENFCSLLPPADANSLQGQLWFQQTNAGAGNLYVRTTIQGTTGGIANWQQIATTNGSILHANNLNGGVAGAVPYQSAPNTTAFTAAGAAGQVFLSTGTTSPVWVSQASLSVGETTNISGGIAGEIPVQTSTGTTSFINVSTAVVNQVLTWNGSAPVWQNTPPSSLATNVVVTDVGFSASTYYPTFVNGAGSQGIDIASANLSFTLASGLSAPGFNGPGTGLTGTAAGLSIGGNAATVTNGLYTTDIGVSVPSTIGTGASGTWNININGTAANATHATTATSATTATTATEANTLNIPGAGVGTFTYSGNGGQPTWLWGTNNGTTMQVWNPSNFITNGLGSQQNWQNPSRAANTTYTNSSGKPIQVCITFPDTAGGTAYVGAYVNGVNIIPALPYDIGQGSATFCCQFIVPNGQTYQVTTSGSAVVWHWSELR